MNFFATFDMIVLFFALGCLASWVKSDLEIPDAISRFFSIFLLLAIGLKGGHEVRISDDLSGLGLILGLGLISCLLLPLALFFFVRKWLGTEDSAGLAASYGSVSAITFVTAQGFLESKGIPSSGFMVAVMALMEIPAIVMALLLIQKFSHKTNQSIKDLWAGLFSTKSVILLLGGFFIGFLMNEGSWKGISPAIMGSFKGVLAFFLLDLGILAQRNMGQAWKWKSLVFPLAILFPLFWGSLFMFLGHSMEVTQGNLILLASLVGSASYIAAPAAIRAAVPSANPSLYLALPLGLTFPMNLILGIPFYHQLSIWLSGS